MKKVNPAEFKMTDTIPPRFVKIFAELRALGSRIHGDYSGMELLQSEFVQVLKVVGRVLALGLFLMKQGGASIEIFNKYASVKQKLKYPSRVALGESLLAATATEANSNFGSSMEKKLSSQILISRIRL